MLFASQYRSNSRLEEWRQGRAGVIKPPIWKLSLLFQSLEQSGEGGGVPVKGSPYHKKLHAGVTVIKTVCQVLLSFYGKPYGRHLGIHLHIYSFFLLLFFHFHVLIFKQMNLNTPPSVSSDGYRQCMLIQVSPAACTTSQPSRQDV